MSTRHNRLKISADREKGTVALKIERRTPYHLEERLQVTFTIKELEAALRDAEISIPWADAQ